MLFIIIFYSCKRIFGGGSAMQLRICIFGPKVLVKILKLKMNLSFASIKNCKKNDKVSGAPLYITQS
jgi:hypothetical protein